MIINQNLKYNLTKKYGEKSKPCIICGERIEITTNNKFMCEDCAKERKKEGQQIEQPVETPVEPEPVANEQKEETLDTPSESQNFEEVFNQRINEIFGEPEQAPVLPNISGEVYPLEQESKGGR